MKVKADVIIGEAQTLLYASRNINPAQVKIFGMKNTIPVAALPGQRTAELVKILREVYPQFVPGDNVLKTSLNNIGAVFHPALTVLNAARIESTRGEFQFYMEGITPPWPMSSRRWMRKGWRSPPPWGSGDVGAGMALYGL